jgi:RHS repeat-associated protein
MWVGSWMAQDLSKNTRDARTGASAGVPKALAPLQSHAIIANSSGAYSSEMRYMPWGEERWASGELPTTFLYTGQHEQKELGLYFYNARWYDPRLSRFLSADSLIPDPYNSQAFDRYAYVFNNPLRYIDPTGHRTCTDQQAATGDETCDQNITDNGGPVIHKIFMGSFYASGPNQPKDQLPESNPQPITNPLVWLSEFIGLIEDLVRPQIPEDNVSLWLTYSEYDNGNVDDFYISMNNQSDQKIYLSRVTFSTERWDEGFATNLPSCVECGEFTARSTIHDYLATIGPQSSTDINLSTYPSNPTVSITPYYGFPPFSGNVSIQVTAYIYANTMFGLWNIQLSAMISAPR